MKELSMEEKARAYDKAIEKAKEFKNNPFAGYDGTDLVSALFPELKESEDERVRQFLIHEIEEASDSFMSYYNMSKKDVLAWLEKQGEQKPSWSEEDERMFFSVIWHLRNSVNNGDQSDPAGKLEPWIRTLKDRVQPHTKQEWSKEDENMLESLTDVLKKYFSGEYGKECIDWLESFKERCTWKPSDEQMDALHYVTNFDYGGHKATLVSLYEQLKKLKG